MASVDLIDDNKGTARCGWCGTDPLYQAYHDHEWGVPLHDDTRLFEFLILEGAQAGLSWITILKKREAYRQAYQGFSPETVARYSDRDVQRLLANPGIVRNRLKIDSSIANARAFLDIQTEFGSADAYFWRFVDGQPLINRYQYLQEVPASTPASEALSKDLKNRGCKFVGPTIMYAFMQAIGMVNDHLIGCHRWHAVQAS